MGKNQAYKAMQRSRLGSGSGGPEEVEDGMVDGSFHSPEWHAARLASLKTSHTITWEEYKQKQKEDRLRSVDLDNDAHKMMREYRAQLDAERAQKLAHGRNHSSSSSSSSSLKRRKHSSSDRKRSRTSNTSTSTSTKRSRRDRDRSSSSSSSSSSESSDSDHSNRRRSKKKSKSKTAREPQGPVPLSRFFHSANS